MDEHEYNQALRLLPSEVILPLYDQVDTLRFTFGPDREYLLNCIIDDVSDRLNYRMAINHRVRQLMARMLEKDTRQHPENSDPLLWRDRRPQLFEPMISFEQTALSIQREVEALQLYVLGRFMPYRYETTLPDNSVVLQLIGSWCDFMDLHPQAIDLYSS